ncbi:MAG TPA: hypothetical protein PLO16_12615 [Acidocella sp.]|nr:hypothetical protein [Acidocella sp.]
MNLPTDIANQALDAIGSEIVLGDIEEGTREAQILLRAFNQCLRQLLRGANWNFARKTASLVMLADATGNTPNVGSMVPTPWLYEYAMPTDCLKVRFIPQSTNTNASIVPAGNIAINQNLPLLGVSNNAGTGGRTVPARFLVATDYNNQPQTGTPDYETAGISPASRTVILTDVYEAQAVYTALMLYPSTWDALFREAMVAYLASQVALAVTKDKKFGFQLRNAQIAIAKDKIAEARVANANESRTSSDIAVDWMATRNGGGGWLGGGYNGFGGMSYDRCNFADGTAY